MRLIMGEWKIIFVDDNLEIHDAEGFFKKAQVVKKYYSKLSGQNIVKLPDDFCELQVIEETSSGVINGKTIEINIDNLITHMFAFSEQKPIVWKCSKQQS